MCSFPWKAVVVGRCQHRRAREDFSETLPSVGETGSEPFLAMWHLWVAWYVCHKCDSHKACEENSVLQVPTLWVHQGTIAGPRCQSSVSPSASNLCAIVTSWHWAQGNPRAGFPSWPQYVWLWAFTNKCVIAKDKRMSFLKQALKHKFVVLY